MILDKNNLLFYSIILISLFVSRLPYIGKYFKVANTLIHESGHAFMALILNAEIVAVELNSDTSGMAITKSASKFKQFLVSLIGYPFAAFFSYIMFYLISQKSYNIIFFVLLSISIINLIFWIKNFFGYLWITTFCALIFCVFYFADDFWKTIFFTFIASIMLSESVISTFQLLIINFKSSSKAGDTKNLEKFTYIPSYFWSIFFVFVSLFFLYKTSILLFSNFN